jgi:hypothetical protein
MGLFDVELSVSEKIGAEVADCFAQDAGGMRNLIRSYKRKTSVTRRRTLQVQWSGWYRRGRGRGHWRKTGPGGEVG